LNTRMTTSETNYGIIRFKSLWNHCPLLDGQTVPYSIIYCGPHCCYLAV
jgi:hypothetical protein